MLDPRLAGLRAIAEALRTSPFQVLRWAATAAPPRPLTERYRDPLRVRSLHGVLFIRRSKLEAWRRRNQCRGAGERVLRGWADICEFAGMRRSAAIAACGWGDDPLPVVRPERERVWAYESALADWCEAHEYAYGVHRLVSEARKSGSTERQWRRRIPPGSEAAAPATLGDDPERCVDRSQAHDAASSLCVQQPKSDRLPRAPSGSAPYDDAGMERSP